MTIADQYLKKCEDIDASTRAEVARIASRAEYTFDYKSGEVNKLITAVIQAIRDAIGWCPSTSTCCQISPGWMRSWQRCAQT